MLFKVPALSFRKLENPYFQESHPYWDSLPAHYKDMIESLGLDQIETFECFIPASELPTDIPLEETNPRDQHMGSKSQRQIESSLTDDNDFNFHILNKGMAISVGAINYNDKTGMVEISLDDLTIHGDIDGGHTYRTIINNRSNPLLKIKFVKIEFITNLNESTLPLVARARNTNIAVQDFTIAELENKFDIVKDALDGAEFLGRVSFKQFEDKWDKTKDISIGQILAVLNLFNLSRYGDDNHPTVSYSSKQTPLKYYLDEYDSTSNKENNSYFKMNDIVKQIFQLHAEIESDFISVYNKVGGSYGNLSFAKSKEGYKQRVRYSDEPKYLPYKLPEALILPILASFRALLEEDSATKKYKWIANPSTYKNLLIDQLVKLTADKLKANSSNPNALGKDSSHYLTLYMVVQRELMKELLASRKG
ncbi:AIPR family protein [Priestia megaterium]|uniref:AIPR family protein n=1 Tax=Priestia megaterium TaxID=1404 RepID=UPI002452C72E|nr:AIPR family protein [Priestia megaterium]MDH3180948.1 AIPR family protein [Priestia megaterium]